MTKETELQPPIIRAEKPDFLTSVRFDSFDLPEALVAGLTEAGFICCTPIQAQTLPLSLAGKDVAGQAQTGTGKTAAFLVTVFAKLIASPEHKPELPSAIIVAPTRELALQIFDEAEILCRHTGLRQAIVIGGIDYQKQADQLRQGADIVICTPGRIIDYLNQDIFKTSAIRIVVIDEADRLLDLGFARDMRYILSRLPHYDERQTLLFSATLSHRVMEMTYEYMNVPESVSVTSEEITVDTVEQTLFHIERDKKLSLLLGLIDKEDWSRMLIFANTKVGVEWLSKKLQGNGLPAEGISGNLSQPRRLRLMDQFKSGKTKILVATDVASRGIHVDNITHVINYDLPQDAENYIHRIGRTARAGKSGRALSLACERYVLHLEPLEKMLGYKLPVVWPEDSLFFDDQCGRVIIEHQDTRSKAKVKRNDEAPKKSAVSQSAPEKSAPEKSVPAKSAPAKSAPAKRSPAKKEKITVGKRSRQPWKRPVNHFPGQFFGFKPADTAASKTQPVPLTASDTDDPKTSSDEKTNIPPKTKRKRRRRNKRTT